MSEQFLRGDILSEHDSRNVLLEGSPRIHAGEERFSAPEIVRL